MGKKILIVGRNYIGDVLFTTPAVRTIRLNLPDSYIVYFIRKKYGAYEVLQGNPDINEIIAYENKMTIFNLYWKIKKEKFDLSFVFARGVKRALIPYFCKVKERVGYITPKRRKFKFLFTKHFEEPDMNIPHRVFYYKQLVDKYFGSEKIVTDYVFTIPQEIEEKIENFMSYLKGYNPIICFHPFIVDIRMWPPENYIKLGNLIKKKFPQCKILITGSGKKESYRVCKYIYTSLKNFSILLAGKTNLKELGAIFKKSNLVIGGDTGPIHIACAVKANVIALFDCKISTGAEPFGTGKYVLIKKNSVSDISPEEVLEKVDWFLNEQKYRFLC